MDSNLDPTTQQQIEGFRRDIEAMASFYAQAVAFAFANRLTRDLEALYESPKPSRRFPFIRFGLPRIGGGICRPLLRKEGQVEDVQSVTILEPMSASAGAIASGGGNCGSDERRSCHE